MDREENGDTGSEPPLKNARKDLVDLVAEALGVLEDGGEQALEDLLARYPSDAEIIRRRLALLIESGLNPGAREREELHLPDVLGDFHLIRPLGQGGMGVVWLAEQQSLGRKVALKLVRPDQMLFPHARERFQREVEVIARMQHPGIVPVYSVGEDKGLPYFVMEYVVGATLAEVLDAMEASDVEKRSGIALMNCLPVEDRTGDDSCTAQAGGLFSGPWPDVSARIAREIAEALEHARRRGVVHRDIKPSNIMITRSGRVQLFDFGLSHRAGDARLTREGALTGSLAYMPPDAFGSSAAGDDTRQDVYGLGVTLYELLTLTLPFPMTNFVDLRAAIAGGAARPIRTANASIPVDLAAIVGKAMELNPARRYGTPGELAQDLDRFLNRLPVLARPPGLLLRTQRWIQRSPARAAFLTALILGPSALLIQQATNRRALRAKNAAIEAVNQDLKTANLELQGALDGLDSANKQLLASKSELVDAMADLRAESAIAEESFQKALAAIDAMLANTAEEKLAGLPGVERVRRDLLEEALELYEWFLQQDRSSSKLQSRVALLAQRAGVISTLLADLDASHESLEKSQDLLEDLVERDSENLESLIQLADTKQRQSQRLRLDGNPEAGLAMARAGLELFDGVSDQSMNPIGRAGVQRARSGLLTELAQCGELLGHVQTAQANLEQAVLALRSGLKEGPASSALRYDLSRALNLLASFRARYVYDGMGTSQRPEVLRVALSELDEALGLAQDLLSERPPHPLARFRLGRLYGTLAYVSEGLGNSAAAAAYLSNQLREQRRLVADHPDASQYVVELADGLMNRGLVLFARGETDAAKKSWSEALALITPLTKAQPRELRVQSIMGVCLAQLGVLSASIGEFTEAEGYGAQGLSVLRYCRSLSPSNPALVSAFEYTQDKLTKSFVAAGRYAGLLEIASAFLSVPPAAMDLEGFAAVLDTALEGAPPEQQGQLIEKAGEYLAAGLSARGEDIFALLVTDLGARLLDRSGLGEAVEKALAPGQD